MSKEFTKPETGRALAGRQWHPFVVVLIAFATLVPSVPQALLAADAFPPELVAFEPYKDNPVFTGAGEGHWDAKIRERGWILRDGDAWHMWYTGYDGTREGVKQLGYATSPDGLHWTRYADNPIYRDGWVEDMMVVKHGDTFAMFAEGRDDIAQLLTSRDGIAWKRVGPLDIRKRDGSPIDPGAYGTPTVWVEKETWHLFYERGDRAIWLATSQDLITWTNVQDKPVLSPGPEKYDLTDVAFNQIIRNDGRYYAYYHGADDRERPTLWTTDVAVSDDLVHWEKFKGNPLFPIAENKSSGILVHDGKQFRLYTMHGRVDVHFPK